MPTTADDCTTIVALALAAVAAIMSGPGHDTGALHKFQELLSVGTEIEAAAMAGAIGQDTTVLLSP
jgi:hypothetical protein